MKFSATIMTFCCFLLVATSMTIACDCGPGQYCCTRHGAGFPRCTYDPNECRRAVEDEPAAVDRASA
ncbi:hypothetical protein PSEUBRA_005835 [Kalmanozyma brasiliensis GHG001]|uniref:uncharacterized protein n=1 Tax=Kalmanozyma brasiliensis (strain GHG001) TaxID=1365824 RepID=UPI002867CD8C|nr:uncharacterized protein PSEUBRA_005835 [Kalmanozyma brasiliensis GHG001]KAF6767565.1 hypothetical protein PSEUBRA_005835 [Kalmanozyma brasiliensis GHG001]